MTDIYDYDLFVIGAGSGGVRAARMAAKFGAKVAIAEASRVGGTCVIRGCVPKKFLVYSSEFGRGFEDARGYGWEADNLSFDWNKLIKNKDNEIDRLNGIYQRLLDGSDIATFHTRASVKGPNSVYLESSDTVVTAKKILIAVGGYPFTDESVEGWELGISSDEALALPIFPKEIAITGGGYIALEFAFIFAGLGSKVTLVYRGSTLLKEFDKDVSDMMEVELKNKNITLIKNDVYAKIEQNGDRKRLTLKNGDVIEVDEVMWAIGRTPSTKGLGLEEVGVKMDKNGAIVCDDYHKTSVDSIFAIGDVTNRVNLTPVAIREGIAFAETQFNDNERIMDYDFIPKAVFSQPPIGSVGMTEKEANDAFDDVQVFKTDFRPMKNILAESQERMLMKLIVNGADDQVLGCHIMGVDSPEMIQCLAIPIKHGITKAQFDATCALHPTAAEELVTL